MRARRITRVPTAAQLAVGASILAFPATAVAFNSTGPREHGQPAVAALHAARPAAVRYGHEATVRGSVSVTAAGVPIELRYRAADARSWHTVARGRVHANGHFQLTARVARSGGLQVVAERALTSADQLRTPGGRLGSALASEPTGTTPSSAVTTTPTATPVVHGVRILSSQVRHLVVKPKLALNGAGHATTAVVGRLTQLHGHLLPAIPGRKVVLEVRQGRRWVPAVAARTNRRGAFDFRYAPAATSSQRVQVAFDGDLLNGRADSAPRSIVPMEYAEVSWYEDAGDTACGFHATYGIASRTLPCGSKVTLSYGGRDVVATVDDRGPFVDSRLYDLNQTTAGALGMHGLATVLASV